MAYNCKDKGKKGRFLPSSLPLLTHNESEPYLAISFYNEGPSVINKHCQKKPNILGISDD